MARCQHEFQTELARVRKTSNSVYLLVWVNDSGEICDLGEGLSSNPNDKVVLSGIHVDSNQCYDPDEQAPDFHTIFEQIIENNLLVAGFHCTDCVPEFALQARRRGFTATIAPRLTDAYHINARHAYIDGNSPNPLPEEMDIRQYKQFFSYLTHRNFDWWFPPHRYRKLHQTLTK